MIKRSRFLVIIFILCIFIPFSVEAKVSCSTVTEEINNYNTIVEEMKDLKCDDVEDSDTVKMCNKYNTEKALSLANLFSYNDENTNCKKSDLKKIVEENKKECTSVFGTELKEIVNTVMSFFYVIAPFLLIIFGILDFSKIVTAVGSMPEVIKKSRKNFVRRLISFILIFFIPAIASFIMNFSTMNISYNRNVYSCTSNISFKVDTWEVTYIPGLTNSVSNSSDSIVVGGITTDEEADKLNEQLNSMLNTQYHVRNRAYQSGPFPPEYNVMEPFQCTWYAQGRATQYLKSINSKYSAYPVNGAYGNGGQWYQKNVDNGWFNYGQSPKPHSIISWTQAGKAGHVAYVEGVGNDGIYISHAGGGKSWFGVTKIPLDGSIWSGSGYVLNGYIYLNEPR